MVLGGENRYKGRNMYDSHKHLGCNDQAFDDIVDILAATLEELGIKKAIINEIARICETLRGDIVTVK